MRHLNKTENAKNTGNTEVREILHSQKSQKGFTLLELIIVISIWTILIAAATQFIWHTTNNAVRIRNEHNALEQARIAVDMLTVNLQMADNITLRTDNSGMLADLELRPRNDNTGNEYYGFLYDFSSRILRFGHRTTQEVALNISEVRLEVSEDNRTITIIVTADVIDSDRQITLTNAVDIRYKTLR